MLMTDTAGLVHCRFSVRTDAGDGLYRYQPVSVSNPAWDGALPTPHPPLTGDLIFLFDNDHADGARGWYRVVDRAWRHPAYGSANWPHTAPRPVHGPTLNVIIEPGEGPFDREEPSTT